METNQIVLEIDGSDVRVLPHDPLRSEAMLALLVEEEAARAGVPTHDVNIRMVIRPAEQHRLFT